METKELMYRLQLWKERLVSKGKYGWNTEDAEVYNEIAARLKHHETLKKDNDELKRVIKVYRRYDKSIKEIG